MVTTDAVVGAHPKAYVSYTVMADVEDEVFTSGVCFGTMTDPDLATGTCTVGDRGIGTFTDTIAGLQNGTLYHVRAYATSTQGTVYGNSLAITSRLSVPGMGVSMDGHVYSTIVLGNGQEWMAENLRTGVFSNGDTIPYVTDNLEWQIQMNGGNPSSTHYMNDPQYEPQFGKLYNWYAVADVRNVCPSGWHVPTDTDWGALVAYLDPSAPINSYFTSLVAGGSLKSPGTTIWEEPNAGATNASGFSGLPGGKRFDSGGWSPFSYIGSYGNWWTANEDDEFSGLAWTWSVNTYDSSATRSNSPKGEGLSVRCVKNQ
jgi:uncharacterized protein (TIGR02145 family)